MHRQILCGLLATAFFAASVCEAGKYNPTRDVGDPAPAWEALPGVDGARHGLDDLKEHEVVVLFFTCNSCPYAVEYEDRIQALADEFVGQRVAFVGVNVNLIPEDSLAAMTARAKERGFQFSYLFDESQQIAVDYGATFTPEFFVLDRERKIAYMGGLDDSSDPSQVKSHYLQDAIEAVLAGEKPPVEESVAIGCRIRMKRVRR